MTQSEVEHEAGRIDKAYQEYLNNLSVLQKERREIFSRFVKRLEEKRKGELRKVINAS
jgi:hypothetical protein